MDRPSGARPRGRRPAGADTRGAIVDAARGLFGTQGYAGVSMRGVARAADVDPALVHHYFESKTALFLATMESPVDPAARVREVLDAGPIDELGSRIVRMVLISWDPPDSRARVRVMLRGVLEHPAGVRAFREFLATAVLAPIGRRLQELGVPDTVSLERRTSLVGSQLLGLIMARYVLELPDVAEASVDELVEQLGPTIQRYLTGRL